jgi:hypothetical protein
VEPGVESDDLTYNAEIAIELIDLTAQVDKAACQRDGIGSVVGGQKSIERGFDERRFCDFATLGGRR